MGGSSSSGRLSLTWVVVESSRRSRPVVDVSGSVHVMIQGASSSMYRGVSGGGGGGGGSGGFVLTSPHRLMEVEVLPRGSLPILNNQIRWVTTLCLV